METVYRRVLKNIIISCPTGMTREEQLALRKTCIDALTIYHQSSEFDVKVIPTIKDVNATTDLEVKENWIYDESTVSQVLWLYTDLVHKFDGDVKALKNAYNVTTKLRIASVDIGGGTSDFMICNYDIKGGESLSEVKPDPIYWDSFYQAGDDLKRELIFRFVVNGSIRDCCIARSVDNLDDRLIKFFGSDGPAQDVTSKSMRKAFINQIGKVLVSKYLDDSNKTESVSYGFDDLFASKGVDEILLKYFEKSFGFKISDIVWESDPKQINKVIMAFFEKQIKVLSSLIFESSPDVVILTGGVFRLNSIFDLFVNSCGLL